MGMGMVERWNQHGVDQMAEAATDDLIFQLGVSHKRATKLAEELRAELDRMEKLYRRLEEYRA